MGWLMDVTVCVSPCWSFTVSPTLNLLSAWLGSSPLGLSPPEPPPEPAKRPCSSRSCSALASLSSQRAEPAVTSAIDVINHLTLPLAPAQSLRRRQPCQGRIGNYGHRGRSL